MQPAKDRRSTHRVTAGAFIEYRVAIDGTMIKDAIMSDISEGGMMVLAESADMTRDIQPGEAISGEILHDRTKFQFRFSGTLVWKQPREMRSRKYIALGIKFSPEVQLPAQIYAILMADHDF
ncbi:MAG: PilZ domain-containing protein [Turneriella sp.]|nr:PilZ domain-containing protein [Leptospiraceae bacterium]MCX7631712.1 PilZ domain-containing protein [Turneriella sp.]